MSLNVQASGGSFSTHNLVVPEITRRSANFHPSVWGDHFLTYTSDLTKTDVHVEGQFQQLKEEVKKMLLNAADKPRQQLSLIDGIQRLGVSYHFESEIEKALQHINDTYHERNNDDLHTAALCFRLLRQHGHNVTCEVFHKFKDNNGKFKEDMVEDVKGMLSLYEATYFRVHGEDILEEAQQFTTSHLKRITSHLSKPLAAQVVHALKVPIQKGLARLQARHYISVYHEDDSHNEVLLQFAKLDFNILQKVHQRELSDIMRWRKDLDLEKKFPFARDRGVECYFWILGVFFEPQYSLARRLLTKVICVASLVDDIYDVYGTLEELEVFTDAIQRWHVSALNQLPEYMKFCYQILLDVYSEMEEEMGKTGRPLYRVDYSKDQFKRLARGYLDEAKWFYRGYIPTMEEYMKVALVTGAYMMLATSSFVGMGEEATKEAFDWISSDPLIVRAASVICRLSDDMVGHQEEQERGNVASSVECYMEQHGVSKQVVYAEFRKRVENAWKDINQECLRPTAIAMPLLTRVVNLARVINFLYDEFDGYTNSNTRTKDFITLVLKNPIPI